MWEKYTDRHDCNYKERNRHEVDHNPPIEWAGALHSTRIAKQPWNETASKFVLPSFILAQGLSCTTGRRGEGNQHRNFGFGSSAPSGHPHPGS